jgi:PadR family transcriptional regulator, regulatory protein AphA
VSRRLSSTSYLVLGLIALRGPSASYDLKRAVGRSVGYFWPFPHTQLYDEPMRLVEAGLLTTTSDDHGRRRRTYSLTPRGLEVLREWLNDSDARIWQVRDEGELKLFFSELADDGAVGKLAAEQARFHEARLGELQAMLERYAGIDDLTNRLAPLLLGVRVERTCLDFWQEVEARGLKAVIAAAGEAPDASKRKAG